MRRCTCAGGGGYTKSNVARCWANETGVLVDAKMDDDIPPHDFYYQYYADAKYKLRVDPAEMQANKNDQAYLESVKSTLIARLKALEHAPAVQLSHPPPDSMILETDDEDLLRDENLTALRPHEGTV